MAETETQAAVIPGAPRTRTPELNPFEAVNYFFNRAADHIGLSDELRDVLTSSYRELTVQVPVRLDDGTLKVFTGYRIQHNGARGPYKGGITAISYILGVNRDVPAPDVNIDAQTMGLDDGRLLGTLRLHACDRDRQTGRARRVLRARCGHRTRRRVLPRGGRGHYGIDLDGPPSRSRASATSARGWHA